MRQSARVVIIGGGIIGCSTAYHLTRLGIKDIVLLEKNQLTSGSTWHAAGLVGQLRSERNITRMLQMSVGLYETLEAETGLSTGWKKTGCLHLASTRDRMYELKNGATTARSFGLEMHILTPKEAYDLCPILSLEGIIGAAFMPTDGQADPSGITQALARGARDRGAKISTDTLVTGFDIQGKRIQAVLTQTGRIECETVVNCTGMWGYQMGRMLGVNTPVVPFQHQILVSEKIPGMPKNLPTIRDKDNLIYYKEEVGGLIMGGYERNGIPWSVDGVSNDFSGRLLEPDFDHFQILSEPALRRTPCLQNVGIVKLINGPEGFTPDGNAIMGPAPELDNLFVAVGFNAFGIAAGGGAGQMMAEWIIHGEPSLDLWPLDIRRFGPHHKSRSYQVERTAELYGKHYTIHWPHEEHDSARGIRRSPLYYLLKAKGGIFGAKYGWERPNWFAPPGVEYNDRPTFEVPGCFECVADEHRRARGKVVLIDQSSFCKFEMTGPKALESLNRLCTNRIDRPVGSVIYTPMCNNRGGIECDLTIARLETERFLLVVGTAFGLRVGWWIRKHLPADGSVVFHEVTSAFGVINVVGPKSRELLQRVTKDDFSSQSFRFGTCKPIVVGHAPAKAFRITYVGELGYELYIPVDFAGHVYETLWKAGQDLSIGNAGYRAINSMRLEKGNADWGSELTPEYTPYDAGLDACVSLDKEDFMGKSALARIQKDKAPWRLCSFTLDEKDPVMIQGSAPIIRKSEVIGVTSSAGYGHTIGKTIAYGYIPAEKAVSGQGWEIESYRKVYPAACHLNRVLYDPQREKIRI
ncbi:MAG: hypothetical protein COS92_08550 [Desulfobacterales bacterium CG07_land_8_20_14_0_80_52_14]|nr:MAG: hypothetical protein COX20_08995 [Desulfobacterales bacterium CG23_combo_of_CG06-09_8_20_14_all_52_9]PIU49087.1 MAG: hypothetical protein COS92_08550 [Desulfobacterales bacterium CG07_land_8_20_14_0_80_52_14]